MILVMIKLWLGIAVLIQNEVLKLNNHVIHIEWDRLQIGGEKL